MIEFNARVISNNRVTIPQWLVDAMNLQPGEILKMALVKRVVQEE